MKKAIKITLCSLALIAILTANVFATWAEESPYYSNYIDNFYAENITSINSTEKLMECVNNAYDIGLFGGAIPFACVSVELNDTYGIRICCSAPVLNGEATGIAKTNEYGNINIVNTTTTRITPELGDYIISYNLLGTGDVMPAQLELEYTELASNEKIIMIKSPQGEWYFDETSEIFAQYKNADETLNPALETINAKYENAMAGEETPPQPPIIQNYILDIPSIITAIPNGAKQIINNTFGFELFGINVAGLLSVLLVVTIVAFVVKWLMSR